MKCGPTHHFGCDCHEKQWRERLEKAERERDDARETLSDVRKAIGAGKNEGIRLAAMRVKAERDEALEQAAQLREKYRIHHEEAEKLTAEIAKASEQRDRLQAKLANALEKLENIRKQLDSCHKEWGNDIQKYLAELRRAEVMLNEAVNQRDALANAIRAFMTEFENGNEIVESLADTLFDSLKVLQGGGK